MREGAVNFLPSLSLVHWRLYYVPLFNCSLTHVSNLPTTWQQLSVFRHDQDNLLKFNKSILMGKGGDLSYIELYIGCCQVGWCEYFRTAERLEFLHTTISRVYREWSEKEKMSSERQFCGQKLLCLMPEVTGE